MRVHTFNPKATIESFPYYDEYNFFYGVLEASVPEKNKIVVWCEQNCQGKWVGFETQALYTLQGIKDVIVYGFMNEEDAVAFKLVWFK